MTNPNDRLDCSDVEAYIDQKVRQKLRKWLGKDGISFFREIKEKHGRVDACWLEGSEDDPDKTVLANAIEKAKFPGIPHPVHFREGMQVRNFLRTIFGDTWTAHDYDNRWAELIEDAIREN